MKLKLINTQTHGCYRVIDETGGVHGLLRTVEGKPLFTDCSTGAGSLELDPNAGLPETLAAIHHHLETAREHSEDE